MSKRFVQRYKVHYAHDIVQMANGEFVTYEAYEQLQSENKRLVEKHAAARSENIRLKSTIETLKAKVIEEFNRAEELVNEVDRLKQALAEFGGHKRACLYSDGGCTCGFEILKEK